MTAPLATRPHMPGYGISPGPEGMLPWSWAEERLAASRNYWVGSITPQGRPHSMPVWGVWLEGALWFSTGIGSRKQRNLAAQPACVITTEHADEAVIVEGHASLIPDGEVPVNVRESYSAKYSWDANTLSGFHIVRPKVVFGFIEHESQFSTAATRWLFEPER